MFNTLQGNNAKKAVKISVITLASAVVLSVPFVGTTVKAATVDGAAAKTEQVSQEPVQKQETYKSVSVTPKATQEVTPEQTTPKTTVTPVTYNVNYGSIANETDDVNGGVFTGESQDTGESLDNGMVKNQDGSYGVKPIESDFTHQWALPHDSEGSEPVQGAAAPATNSSSRAIKSSTTPSVTGQSTSLSAPASQSGMKTFPQTGEDHNPIIGAFGGLLAVIASVLGFKKRNA
ncbi:LPXTG cell wall anchor domain-containing protein [Companilactobacillus sp.]|jgi:LPXTG-motif cell wall-anchored protein|uniref:LPXTG cell wall anchor domain-containing protein n=1 Tax=Companilactobacillus sp. TaxID=2767905 RepID=UPI0025C257FF|nr:LPXTG cell wall anchor domain-containing protein [Companilactobacillus sp.]MCH4008269.1 LPXTG cell wall anchor domain-containing protein [Companilactobacillus sp.]MCH4051552.1 LPXTG cell wall anchor domain-containing protein [Companilactobacillus sp.]MCH4076212.1 LPXTG cell wall anchor domain-containing protein [Companilactobacillus sp.]MCH4124787.1 LPXTG cell wall anchor domain-containing protein [Companilactobacillus sp.]MCH4131329.1 LPXTG cell wall anchor domain-containing protein [Compa